MGRGTERKLSRNSRTRERTWTSFSILRMHPLRSLQCPSVHCDQEELLRNSKWIRHFSHALPRLNSKTGRIMWNGRVQRESLLKVLKSSVRERVARVGQVPATRYLI